MKVKSPWTSAKPRDKYIFDLKSQKCCGKGKN